MDTRQFAGRGRRALDRAFELPKALEWYVRAGAEQAEDVARNNAHDAFHHLWDVDRWTAGNLTSTTPSLG